MKRLTKVFIIIATLIATQLRAQSEIKGATCVIPKTEYDYFILGNGDSTLEVSVCVQGGKFSGDMAQCINVKSQSQVRVIWNENTINASINITYKGGAKSLEVTVTRPLSPGKFLDSLKKQVILFNLSPAIIICAPATGGSCSPVYVYQWQESSNALKWNNILGATGQNLFLGKLLKETIFYRRQVTEKNSGTIMYSDFYSTFVNAEIKSLLPL